MADFFDDKEDLALTERQDYYDQRLSEMVNLGYQRSEKVKDILDELGVSPSGIKTLKDIEKLPIISREKLVELEAAEPPFGGLCDRDIEIDRIFTSPGPVYEPHLAETDYLWARAYHAAGFRKGDVVLNAFSYHMVAAGLTFHGGLRNVGATVVPSGTSGTEIQVQLIRDLDVTGYTGTPSFLMAIIKKAEEMGYDFKNDFKLRRASFAAEPLEPSLREKFEKEYGIDTYQMYGATEVGDVAYECREKNGWHICEEVIVEIVDPATGKQVGHGELGEVVVTRLNNIFFLFRFGTGDLSSIISEACPCGRTSYRLSGIAGRVGDAVKVRGLFIAPSQLKKISERFDNVRFQVVISRALHKDILTVRLEAKGEVADRDELQNSFENFFKEICTVKIDKIELIKPATLSEGDKLIVDQRSWE
ncbi:MAG: AMP-binding protein [Syntrophales bacterium]|nr:AMP-binding protein [Syntrophales bacterium]